MDKRGQPTICSSNSNVSAAALVPSSETCQLAPSAAAVALGVRSGSNALGGRHSKYSVGDRFQWIQSDSDNFCAGISTSRSIGTLRGRSSHESGELRMPLAYSTNLVDSAGLLAE